MKHLFLEDLKDFSHAEVKNHLIREYTASRIEIQEYNVIIAYESVGSWGCDSTSFFLLQNKKTNKYFEVHGSHCSCYGFENQFKPEQTTLKYLKSEEWDFYVGGYDKYPDSNKADVKAFLKTI
jgi:hypothetical protein